MKIQQKSGIGVIRGDGGLLCNSLNKEYKSHVEYRPEQWYGVTVFKTQ